MIKIAEIPQFATYVFGMSALHIAFVRPRRLHLAGFGRLNLSLFGQSSLGHYDATPAAAATPKAVSD